MLAAELARDSVCALVLVRDRLEIAGLWFLVQDRLEIAGLLCGLQHGIRACGCFT